MKLAIRNPPVPLLMLLVGVGVLLYLAHRQSAARQSEPRVEVFMGTIERYE